MVRSGNANLGGGGGGGGESLNGREGMNLQGEAGNLGKRMSEIVFGALKKKR